MAYWEPEGYYQLGEGRFVDISAENVLTRMREITQTHTLSDLALCLGTRLALLTDAKRRNIIPIGWVQSLAHQFSCDTFWILTGQNVPR